MLDTHMGMHLLSNNFLSSNYVSILQDDVAAAQQLLLEATGLQVSLVLATAWP